MPAHPPVATYRVQVRAGFDLRDVRRILPYLDRLGVDTVYLSPLLAARPGSSHGYDGIDPARPDPDRVPPGSLPALVRAARARGMGLLLDLVPNHLAADPLNPAWRDVLQFGRRSSFARTFDIDWAASPGRPRIRLPVLPAPGADAGTSAVELDRSGLELGLRCGAQILPLSPRSLATVLGEVRRRWVAEGGGTRIARRLARIEGAADRLAHGPGRALTAGSTRLHEQLARLRSGSAELETLFGAVAESARPAGGLPGSALGRRVLADQEYQLIPGRESWRVNYRRFFDVAGLVGVRVEDPGVFRWSHGKVLEWTGKGYFRGIRVDHVDGLADPRAYLQRLHRALGSRAGHHAQPSVWVEKILAPREELPPSWPVEGSTGYDAMARIDGLLVDPDGLDRLDRIYRQWVPRRERFGEVAFHSKREVLRRLFREDVHRISARMGWHRPPPRPVQASALGAITVGLDLYRTYWGDTTRVREDRASVRRAIRSARARAGVSLSREVARTGRALLAQTGRPDSPGLRSWQQWTGAVAAKGVEDTALYRYARLAGLCEVGGDPGGSLVGEEEFHSFMSRRARHSPRSLTATTTHDTKWGEEVRARLAVLADVPERWEDFLKIALPPLLGRRGGSRGPRCELDPVDALRLLQAAVGTWPTHSSSTADYARRLEEYALKSVREARLGTSWESPNTEYEARVRAAVRRMVSREAGDPLARTVAEFGGWLAAAGRWNVLAVALVRTTVPGIPDLYQGAELSSDHFVDPDNRRPVDFRRLERLLRAVAATDRPRPLVQVRRWTAPGQFDRLRMYVVHRALWVRRTRAALFRDGEYQPISVRGVNRGRVAAFLRRRGPRWVLVVVGLGPAANTPGPAGRGTFAPEGSRLLLPPTAPDRWRDELADRPLLRRAPREDSLALGEVLDPLPVALLTA
ncbi:MAG TPA: malto-oligosyltrehalose synthase [Thermoplasmata archaeon]|nr:malto-oligosyltrehalose synthase [Thermoplasmata archaeon]